MTQHEVKFFVVFPAGMLNAARTWVTANIDPDGAAWFALALSPTGAAPATFHAACFHATRPEAKTWIGRFLQMVTGVSDPRGQWSSWTRAERLDWFATLRTALRQQRNVYLRVAWNDQGQTPDVLAELAERGLQPVTEGS